MEYRGGEEGGGGEKEEESLRVEGGEKIIRRLLWKNILYSFVKKRNCFAFNFRFNSVCLINYNSQQKHKVELLCIVKSVIETTMGGRKHKSKSREFSMGTNWALKSC